MDDAGMMQILRDHLGRDPIGVLAQRLHMEPDEILEVLTHRPARLLDLTEDEVVIEAVVAVMLARVRRF